MSVLNITKTAKPAKPGDVDCRRTLHRAYIGVESGCPQCGRYIKPGGYSTEELVDLFDFRTITAAPDPLDVASVKANPPSKEHLEAERAWREACSQLEVIDREHAAAFAASQDPGERRRLGGEGGFFEFVSERARTARARSEELKRRREDIEQDVQRARARVAQHEWALDRRRLIWRDKHRAGFERH